MSEPSSLHNAPTLTLSLDKIKAEHNISLIDHTKPREAERSPSSSTAAPSTAEPPTPLFKRLTNNSLSLQESVKQQLAKQKYAKYGQDRYTESSGISSPTKAGTDDAADTLTRTSTGVLERGRQKAKGLLKRKRTRRLGDAHADTAIDILYENQRGWFLFGVPRFSASTLLPSDPRPWQNAQFRTSPVSILFAQVPDPNWEWVWRSWYVDMSRDVDEEGWEYSLMFRQETNWHGNHPWFHSFVRRRRWVRMRRRKGEQKGEGGHELSAEYFTIHPKTLKPSSDEVRSRSRAVGIQSPRSEDVPIAKMEVSSIGDLALALRKAAVDREKLVAVRKFVTSAGDELFYLAEHMEEIMGRFVYQSSRRQLLSELIGQHDAAHEQQDALADHDHKGESEKIEQHGDAVKRAENLHRAVRAAEDQVGRLEYWSDVKGMPHTNGAAAANGHDSDAFKNKQTPSEGAPELHKHPEHTEEPVSPTNGKAGGGAVSKQSSRSVFFDAPGSPPSAPPTALAQKQRKTSSLASRLDRSPGDESDSSTGYVTAGESVHDDRSALSPAQQGREKAVKLGGLDGLMDEEPERSLSPEEDEDGDAEADAHESYQPSPHASDGEQAAEPESPSALSGRGAGGTDEVVVSGEDAKAAEDEGQGLRLLASEPEIGKDVDVVEEGK